MAGRGALLFLVLFYPVVALLAAPEPTFRGYLLENGALKPNCLIGLCVTPFSERVDPLAAQEPPEKSPQRPEQRPGEGFATVEDMGAMGVYQERVEQERRSYEERVLRHRESYRRQVEGFGLLQ